MESVLDILKKSETYFASKGVPNPKIDAQILLSHVFGCSRLDLFLKFESPVLEPQLSQFRELVRRRGKREPLQHILGNVEFFGINLKCDSRALIPRPETEEMCEIITSEIFDDPKLDFNILDLGTGSGAIALALANFYENASVCAVDFSKDALSLARENAEKCALESRVEFIESNWFENLKGKKFDLIVSNPPYLSSEEVDSAEAEVKNFDPKSALISEEDGIADLKKILVQSSEFLNAGAFLVCECGLGQPEKLAELAASGELKSEFENPRSLSDSSGRGRFFVVKKRV